jgi:hypothetical protein
MSAIQDVLFSICLKNFFIPVPEFCPLPPSLIDIISLKNYLIHFWQVGCMIQVHFPALSAKFGYILLSPVSNTEQSIFPVKKLLSIKLSSRSILIRIRNRSSAPIMDVWFIGLKPLQINKCS